MNSDVHEGHVLPTPVEVLDGEVVSGESGASPIPWNLDVRIRDLDASVVALDREVRASTLRLGPEYVALWARFVEVWRHYHRDHRSTLLHAWHGTFAWGDVHEQVAGFELRAAQWRRATEERGVRVPIPEVTPRQPSTSERPAESALGGGSILAAFRAAVAFFNS